MKIQDDIKKVFLKIATKRTTFFIGLIKWIANKVD